MNAATRLAAFGLASAVALGGGAALGAAAGPAPTPTSPAHADHEGSAMSTSTLTQTAHAGHGAQPASATHRLRAERTVVEAGTPQPFTFELLDPAGTPLTQFEDRHERPLHLIVISNDLTGYAHLHPVLGDGGIWTVELPALVPGGYRLIADTAPVGGPDLVLTVDLVVPGNTPGQAMPEPTDTVTVDGLDVTLDLVPSPEGVVAELTVRRDGTVIEPDPYLGARGHLVAIDADDLAYLHVHPTDGTGPVSFAVAEPDPGRYRLFFDFSVDGTVRTAAFTVDLGEATTPAAEHTHTAGESHP